FESGKVITACAVSAPPASGVLQWGRPHSRAESVEHVRDYTRGTWSFNGAALIRERKVGAHGRECADRARFNGAALIRERKVRGRSVARSNPPQASMGPPSFESGKEARHRPHPLGLLAASMGPPSFESGKPDL